ncbi:MAG: glyceraldehyde 3-phosphate dehydrogenase NAD-binding domain-containing protein, partial [Candidatus Omnitrophota bacterium]
SGEYIPSAPLRIVDVLDGTARVELNLTQNFEQNSSLIPVVSALFRSLSNNRDIEISAIVAPVSAEELARVIRSNPILGPWRGVTVTAEGNTLVIKGVDSERRIPVNKESASEADISVFIGDIAYGGVASKAKRVIYFPVGSTEVRDLTALPGGIGEWDEAVVNLSEITGLAVALEALGEELGSFGIQGRIDVFYPDGDMTIVPSVREVDVSRYLAYLGITFPEVKVSLHATKVSGAIKGARMVETVITFPGEVTKEDLIRIFEAHPLLGVAPEESSTSAMFLNPGDTKLFYLNSGKTVVEELKDGSTRVILRGWVGDYSYAGMMIAGITEVAQRLSELGVLSTQKADVIYPAVEHPKVQVLAQPRKVIINGGAGRIGLNILRSLIGDPNFNVVAVNGVRSAEALRQGLLYDEVLGSTKVEIETGKEVLNGKEVEFITINGYKIYVFNAREAEEVRQLPLGALGIEYVLEASGNYTKADDFEPFFTAGAKYGFISAPAKDKNVPEIVPGVNHGTLVDMAGEKGLPRVVSFGSCTTNNSAPVIMALINLLEGKGVRVEEVSLETVHAVTQTQAHLLPVQIRDPQKVPERARAGGLNIVVSSTGAAKVLPKIITGIDRMHGIALRVGNPNGSESQITFYLSGLSPVTSEEIVAYLQERARTDLRNILVVNTGGKLDSLAINGSDITSIVEASTVKVVPVYDAEGKHVSDVVVLNTWYDNEWGYTQQYIRGIIMFALLEENPSITKEELLYRSDRLGEYAYSPVVQRENP